MDKPTSMPVKEYLMKVMSIKTNTPLATIEAVVSHQFEEIVEALKVKDSVEVSGFGKFLFKRNTAKKKLEKQYMKKDFFTIASKDESLTEQKRQSYLNKLNNTIKELDALKARLEINA